MRENQRSSDIEHKLQVQMSEMFEEQSSLRGNSKLLETLEIERLIRENNEKQISQLNAKILELESALNKKTSSKPKNVALPYSEFKSDGKRKARPAESIRSYDDFKGMQDYFLNAGKIRDWALWTIGVSLGLRVSDLLSLKVKSVLNPDGTFRDRLFVTEQKTSKLNNCLITEAVKLAITKLFESENTAYDMEDYLFKSNKTKGKMTEEYGWKILSDAGKALSLPIVVGSHTMRKSFANIAACVDKSTIDMNSIVKIQGLLNHSDQRVTMRYLGSYQKMFDKARCAVSDFVLGKTAINEIVAGHGFTIDDVIAKLDNLELKLI